MKANYLSRLCALILCHFFILNTSAQVLPSFDREKLLDLFQAQKYAEAIAYLDAEPMEQTPGLVTYKQYAYAHYMAGQLAQAENYYLKMLDLDPQVSTLYNLAQIKARRGQQAESAQYLHRILSLDSNFIAAYTQLADYYASDTTGKSLELLAKAHRLAPSNPNIAQPYAVALSAQKAYEQAYQVIELAKQADTNNLNLWQLQIQLTNPLKRFTETIQIGKRLLAEENNPDIQKLMALAYFNLRQYTACIDLLEEVVAGGDSAELNYYYLSISYRNIGKLEPAAHYAKLAIAASISPNISNYYLMHGSIQEMNQEYKLAEATYLKGISYQALPELYFRIALLHDNYTKQSAKAIENYKKYLSAVTQPEANAEQLEFVKSRLQALTPSPKPKS